MKPFTYFARCQYLTALEQLHKGVRCFDFRIRFSNGTPYLCHGIIEYPGDIETLLDELSFRENIYIRLGFENIYGDKDYNTFIDYAHRLIELYPNIKFQICKKKPNWTIIENNFDKDFVEVQAVPTWKNIWKGPEGLLYLQEEKINEYKDKDVIMSMDFV